MTLFWAVQSNAYDDCYKRCEVVRLKCRTECALPCKKDCEVCAQYRPDCLSSCYIQQDLPECEKQCNISRNHCNYICDRDY